jgi:hypothetical protein
LFSVFAYTESSVNLVSIVGKIFYTANRISYTTNKTFYTTNRIYYVIGNTFMYLGTILNNRKYLCKDRIFYGIPQDYMPRKNKFEKV